MLAPVDQRPHDLDQLQLARVTAHGSRHLHQQVTPES
jgi:hypothetical protein